MKIKGFTLIELLVVISIVGLLSSIVLASLQSAQKKAYNAKIIQQAEEYRTAIKLYYSDHGFYPPTGPQNGPTTEAACYGTYEEMGCYWSNDEMYYGSINDEIQNYIPSLPPVNAKPLVSNLGFKLQSIYACYPESGGQPSDPCASFTIQYALYYLGPNTCPESYQQVDAGDVVTCGSFEY